MSSELVIAHISDLHYPLWKEDSWLELNNYLKGKKPNAILVTGDLTNQPWPKHHRQVKQKLMELVATCKGDGSEPGTLIVVPGNHDYAFWGNWNFGTSPLWRISFHLTFKDSKKSFYEFPIDDKHKALFFCFNSNAFVARWARGVISRRQLRRFQDKVDELRRKDEEAFEAAYKIVALHHHPMPIPYSEKFESYMVLKNAGEFLRLLAQCKIDLVLHGHKHHSVLSAINLGTISSTTRKISIVASGSTLKQEESHNDCNIITLRRNRWAEVTPVFAPSGERFQERDSILIPSWEDYIEDQYLAAKNRLGYEIDKIRRNTVIDEHGDGNTYSQVESLNVVNSQSFRGIEPFAISVDAGRIKGFEMDCPPQVENLIQITRDEDEEKWVRIGFKAPADTLAQNAPLSFNRSYWTLNNWALTKEEFIRKYADKLGRSPGEEVWFTCARPIKLLNVEIQLPNNCKPVGLPELLIFAPTNGGFSTRPEKGLQTHLAAALNYSSNQNVIFLSVIKPLLGYKYSVHWYLPQAVPNEVNPKYRAETEELINQLKETAKSSCRLDKLAEVVEKYVRTELNIPERQEIDVTLAVPLQEPGNIALLKFIAANLVNSRIKGLQVPIGDGVAGRAYKANELRSYIARKARGKGSKPDVYIRFGDYVHEVLYSVPLRHPLERESVIGVLSVGSKQAFSSLIPADINNVDKHLSKIAEIAETYVVARLDDICGGVLSKSKS